MKVRFLLLVALVAMGLFVLPTSVLPAHALQVGLVCLADPSSVPSNHPCIGSQAEIFNGPVTLPNQQVRIGVFVNSSAGLNGFDITLAASNSVLEPGGVDLAGTVLKGTPVVLQECLSGVPVQGSICASTDVPGTVHLAAVSAVGSPNTMSPTSGLLFTAIYNITATTTSQISLDFPSGCKTSSVGSGVCVTVVDGTRIPVPETVRGATFNNKNPPPFLTLASNSSGLRPMIVGSSFLLRLNLTGQSGWNVLGCPCPAIVSIVEDTSLTAVFNQTNVLVPSSGPAFVSLNITSAQAGSFSVTVFAQYSTIDLQNFNTDTLVAPVIFHLTVTDFSLSVGPPSVTPVMVGMAGSSLLTITSLNGFSGTVLLSLISGTGCSLSRTSLLVVGSASSTLTCSSTTVGNVSAIVTGTSVPVSHSLEVIFSIQDFAISLSSSLVKIQAGSSGTVALRVTGLNGFSQQVTVSISAPLGLSVSTVQSTLLAPGNVNLTIMAKSVGMYTVNLTVLFGTFSRSSLLKVNVTTVPGGSSGLFGIPSLVFYSIITSAGLMAVATATWVILRRRAARSASVSAAGKRVGRKDLKGRQIFPCRLLFRSP